MDCTRKHTLVTGCSSGIGRATALRLAAAGQPTQARSRVRHRAPTWGDLLAGGTGRIGRLDPVMPTDLCCELGPRGDIQLGEHAREMRLHRPA